MQGRKEEAGARKQVGGGGCINKKGVKVECIVYVDNMITMVVMIMI